MRNYTFFFSGNVCRALIIHSIGYKQFTFEWKVEWRIEKQMTRTEDFVDITSNFYSGCHDNKK